MVHLTRDPEVDIDALSRIPYLKISCFFDGSDICRIAGFSFCIAKASGCPEAFAAVCIIQFII